MNTIRKIVPSALLLGALLVASPLASAHWRSNNVYMGGPLNVTWNCNTAFGCLLMVDFVTYTPYPFRLAFDNGFWYRGHCYKFYHRYFVYGEGYRDPSFGTFFGMGQYGQPSFHTYYYYTY